MLNTTFPVFGVSAQSSGIVRKQYFPTQDPAGRRPLPIDSDYVIAATSRVHCSRSDLLRLIVSFLAASGVVRVHVARLHIVHKTVNTCNWYGSSQLPRAIHQAERGHHVLFLNESTRNDQAGWI